MKTDDKKVIERVLKGDTEAFNMLVRQWEKPIYNFILRMIGDRDEAMDLCQDCFMKAYRELRTLKDHDRFASWLYRIAHNTCLSRIRKDYGKTWVELDPDTRPSRMPIENQLAVQKALQHLPEDQREVVVLKVFHYANDAKGRIKDFLRAPSRHWRNSRLPSSQRRWLCHI